MHLHDLNASFLGFDQERFHVENVGRTMGASWTSHRFRHGNAGPLGFDDTYSNPIEVLGVGHAHASSSRVPKL